MQNRGRDRRTEVMTNAGVEANPSHGTRMLNVIIITRKVTSRRIGLSERMNIRAMMQESHEMVVLIMLPPPQMVILLLFFMIVSLI